MSATARRAAATVRFCDDPSGALDFITQRHRDVVGRASTSRTVSAGDKGGTKQRRSERTVLFNDKGAGNPASTVAFSGVTTLLAKHVDANGGKTAGVERLGVIDDAGNAALPTGKEAPLVRRVARVTLDKLDRDRLLAMAKQRKGESDSMTAIHDRIVRAISVCPVTAPPVENADFALRLDGGEDDEDDEHCTDFALRRAACKLLDAVGVQVHSPSEMALGSRHVRATKHHSASMRVRAHTLPPAVLDGTDAHDDIKHVVGEADAVVASVDVGDNRRAGVLDVKTCGFTAETVVRESSTDQLGAQLDHYLQMASYAVLLEAMASAAGVDDLRVGRLFVLAYHGRSGELALYYIERAELGRHRSTQRAPLVMLLSPRPAPLAKAKKGKDERDKDEDQGEPGLVVTGSLTSAR